MGNKQCQGCQQTFQQNKAYGTFEVINQFGHLFAVVQKKIQKPDKNQLSIIIEKLEDRLAIVDMHIARLYRYQIKPQVYGYRLIMHYQYLPKTLRDKILELKNQGINFTQKQLFSIIYGVEQGLFKLNEHNIRHGCINTQSIVCKNNFYKITDVSTTTCIQLIIKDITGYHLALIGDRNQFLSEKLLDCLSYKSITPSYEIKDDLFSLGMIVLSIATNRSALNFYEWKDNYNVIFKKKIMENALKEMEKNYSSRLIKKLKSLIIVNSQYQLSDSTNLSQSLQQVNQGMIRVMNKIKKYSNN